MGGSVSTNHELNSLMQENQVLGAKNFQGITMLRDKKTRQQYLLRVSNFKDEATLKQHYKALKKQQKKLQDNEYICQINKIIPQSHTSMCVSHYQIYVLMQYHSRTLRDQINARQIKNCKFEQQQLWSIVAQCMNALDHMQNHSIKHQALHMKSILLSSKGTVKIYDPSILGQSTNYQSLSSREDSQQLYLSPQLTINLSKQVLFPQVNPFKSDVWTLGMLILEVGLGDPNRCCYSATKTSVDWHNIQKRIQKFSQKYSSQLTALLQIMLSQQSKRPTWLQLSARLLNEQSYSQHNSSIFNVNVKAPLSVSLLQNPQQNSRKTQTFISIQPAFAQNVRKCALSQIDSFRPNKNTFPVSTYITKTAFDQNLQQIPQQHTAISHDVSNLQTPQSKIFSFVGHSHQKQKDSLLHVSESGQYVVEMYALGGQYRGHKWRGMRHGYGVFEYQQGGLYQGEWNLDKMHGQGSLYYASRQLAYHGTWHNDQFHGKGVLYNEFPISLNQSANYQDLDEIGECWTKYEGYFSEDLRSGQGKFYLTNGQWFQGSFVNDVAQGKGVFCCIGGKMVHGIWKDNRIINSQ